MESTSYRLEDLKSGIVKVRREVLQFLRTSISDIPDIVRFSEFQRPSKRQCGAVSSVIFSNILSWNSNVTHISFPYTELSFYYADMCAHDHDKKLASLAGLVLIIIATHGW